MPGLALVIVLIIIKITLKIYISTEFVAASHVTTKLIALETK